jgi:hypothetical protein
MMQIAGFEFSDGARFQAGVHPDANIVGNHIEMLRAQSKGELTPQDVLDDAKHSNSPLHSFFEWDDSAAAQHFRLNQARGLIRAVVAIYTHDDKPATRVKAYVHIPEPGAPHYRSAEQAMSQQKTRDLVLMRAWREFQQWRKRYEELDEFAEIFRKADAVASELPLLKGE